MTPIRVLLTGLVDYAGLFPPQSLDMLRAVRRYREYLSSDDRWALGRFVVPAPRLAEFSEAFNEVCCGEREPMWRLSVLSSGDAVRDEEGFEGLTRGAMLVDSLEMKAETTAQAERLLADSETGTARYVEFAPSAAAAMLPVLARFGARAKIRMGGVVADAFPTVDTAVEFLTACARAKVAFKATAGLHHAVRGTYPLTYEPQSARATMHGFVNMFLAAVLAYRGESQSSIAVTLEETSAAAFNFGDESVRWRGFEAGVDEIEVTRRKFAISYGSCSFSEPIKEARHWEMNFREARSLEW